VLTFVPHSFSISGTVLTDDDDS